MSQDPNVFVTNAAPPAPPARAPVAPQPAPDTRFDDLMQRLATSQLEMQSSALNRLLNQQAAPAPVVPAADGGNDAPVADPETAKRIRRLERKLEKTDRKARKKKSFLPLWIALVALVLAILVAVIVSRVLASKDAEITGLQTDTKVASVRNEVQVGLLVANAKTDAIASGLLDKIGDEVHLVRDEIHLVRDDLDDKADKTAVDALGKKVEEVDRRSRSNAGRLTKVDDFLKQLGEEQHRHGHRLSDVERRKNKQTWMVTKSR